ncbi:MAG: tetratricopeptide repeat protein [Terriglobia bacterium]
MSEEALSSLSRSGGLVGTLAYMAPEQIEGGKIGPATDIYALGLVVYEMVTGRRPFQADDAPAFAAAMKRLKEPPPSPRTYIPDLDSNWEAAILRCLEIDPACRFQSALEVAVALVPGARSSPLRNAAESPEPGPGAKTANALDDDSAPDRRPQKEKASSSSPFTYSENDSRVSGRVGAEKDPRVSARGPSRKVIVTALVLMAAVSLLALTWGVPQVREKAEALWTRLSGGGPSRVAPGATVFLTEIENVTGDPQLNGVTELLRSALGQSAHFNLMSPSRVCEVLQTMTKPCDAKLDPATAREVAMRDGVPRVVFGTLSKTSEDYVLNLDIEKPDTEPTHRRQHWTQTFSASSKNDLFDRVRDGSDWVRKTVGEAETELALRDRLPQEVTTNSWSALELFALAEQKNANGEIEAAISYLRDAVKQDPHFTLAYMRLGDLLDYIGSYREGYAAWQEALNAPESRHLSEREELRVRSMFASDVGNYATAEEIFNQYALRFPDEYQGYYYRALPLMMLGRLPEAIHMLLEAQKRNPTSDIMPLNLGAYNIIVKGPDQAQRVGQYVATLRKMRQVPDADAVEGQYGFLQEDYAKAERLFLGLRDASDPYWQVRSYSLQGCLYAEQGRYQEAIRALKEGIDADIPTGRRVMHADRLLALAYLYYKEGEAPSCRAACLSAISLDQSFQRLTRAGTLLARTGFVEDARRILEGLQRDFRPGELMPISQITRSRIAGEIKLAQGIQLNTAS